MNKTLQISFFVLLVLFICEFLICISYNKEVNHLMSVIEQVKPEQQERNPYEFSFCGSCLTKDNVDINITITAIRDSMVTLEGLAFLSDPIRDFTIDFFSQIDSYTITKRTIDHFNSQYYEKLNEYIQNNHFMIQLIDTEIELKRYEISSTHSSSLSLL